MQTLVRSGFTTIPVGTIMDFAGTAEPENFLFCYGQEVSRETYAALFTVIGTTYGAGNGTSSFLLPDLRGRVAAGKDNMGGTNASRISNSGLVGHGVVGTTLGDAGGSEQHTLTVAELAYHQHNFSDYYQISVQMGQPGTIAFENDIHFEEQGAFTANTTAAAGSNHGHNNIQPTIILNKIIRYQ